MNIVVVVRQVPDLIEGLDIAACETSLDWDDVHSQATFVTGELCAQTVGNVSPLVAGLLLHRQAETGDLSESTVPEFLTCRQ